MTLSQGNNPKNESLAKLVNDIETTTELTKQLISDVKNNNSDFTRFKTELNHIRTNVQTLSALVRDGNGDLSIISKLAVINEKFIHIEKQFLVYEKQLEANNKEFKQNIDTISADIYRIKMSLTLLEKTVAELSKEKENSLEKLQKEELSRISIRDEKIKGIIKITVTVITSVIGIILAIIASL